MNGGMGWIYYIEMNFLTWKIVNVGKFDYFFSENGREV